MTLREWLDSLDAKAVDRLAYQAGRTDNGDASEILEALAAHLPALREAVETQEAVAWCAENQTQIERFPTSVIGSRDSGGGYPWCVFTNGISAGGDTLPEAVAALKAKLGETEGR